MSKFAEGMRFEADIKKAKTTEEAVKASGLNTEKGYEPEDFFGRFLLIKKPLRPVFRYAGTVRGDKIEMRPEDIEDYNLPNNKVPPYTASTLEEAFVGVINISGKYNPSEKVYEYRIHLRSEEEERELSERFKAKLREKRQLRKMKDEAQKAAAELYDLFTSKKEEEFPIGEENKMLITLKHLLYFFPELKDDLKDVRQDDLFFIYVQADDELSIEPVE